MRSLTVSFFGHRKIFELNIIEEKIRGMIQEILKKTDFVEILIGRNGEFDEFVASIIKSIQKDGYESQIGLTLVLPYYVSQIKYLEKYYDRIIIFESNIKVHPKRAITLRNRYMVECSDFVIGYVKQKGGAFNALKYAEKISKPNFNIALYSENNE